ncbi:nuclease-like protein [Sinorhizobium medicae]|uniref:thermonuclease family protein n=1 Tax=Sinorhizobium medicae TaxID=110321 RepID=UPI0011996AC2|nr:thermonuclease family protein [Sinorhizobium medicae]TWA12165.1 nuclease-like protein [Sinorhizobium medicae]TWA33173.1 nuclease-like protein [Sinorhizobium medicae]
MNDNVIQFRKRKKPKPKPNERPKRNPSPATTLIGVVGVAVYTCFSLPGSPAQASAFARCGTIKRNCVVDGDTLYVGAENVRVADIDTPEISEPKCVAEKALGEQATERLVQLVNAGPFDMRAWEGRDEDQYGRKLRVLVRNGRTIGDVLVSQGLARTRSGRREPWC